ncbi:MAG: glutaminase A [Nocardioides sp.]|nr:glutaminase A [Nocardioides sp.]
MRNPVQQYLETIVEQCGGTEGSVADYIPELANADPDRFAMCLATVDGFVYEVGDADARYTIQSISKPFTYGLALADRGIAGVEEKVGVEPSGEGFNEISLDDRTHHPDNPMINAGAIATASLIEGTTPEERFGRLLEHLSAYAGRELTVDEGAMTSEIETAHRNRAIAHMLKEFDVLEGDPEESLQQYIRQCSITVDTRDLALMAATLANGGIQPRTGEAVLEPALVQQVLSVMTTCGMYDAAGDWVSVVGMPAKSGVSGGIIAVLPGQVGLAVFSPRLDEHGTSARGVALCERMSQDMEMHMMHVGRGSRAAVRTSYSLDKWRSRRSRLPEEEEILDRVSHHARVYELHGDLLFAGAESVVRAVIRDAPELAILDVRLVDEIAEVARVALAAMRAELRDIDAECVLVDPEGRLAEASGSHLHDTRVFRTLDAAVAWGEAELLRRHGGLERRPKDAYEDHPLLDHLSVDARVVLREAMRSVEVAEGTVVLEPGDPFAGIHIIVSGRFVSRVRDREGDLMTLVTLDAGNSFGELALGTDDSQESEISAATDARLLVLSADEIERITREHPGVALEFWRAMARDGYRLADRALRRGTSAHTPASVPASTVE